MENQFENAALLIHQQFCYELVRLTKLNPKKVLKDISGVKKVFDAIEVLEGLYPKLKKNALLKS